MKLISLQIVGIGEAAWSSKKLVFGSRVTQLFGSNGCGKTPIVRSIVFALGYKVEYRDDILEHCDHVVLEVMSNGREFVIKRKMRGPFHVTVSERGAASTEFVNEREYSRFLLSVWGMDDPILTTVDNKSAYIYSTQILPFFYLDQDHGYAYEYYSTSRFIKNQYAEVMRLIYGLAPKNSFDKRRARSELKEELERLDRAVIRSEKIIDELSSDLGTPRRPLSDIDRELAMSMNGLEALRASGAAPEQVNLELDTRIAYLQQLERSLLLEQSDLEARVRGFTQIRNEIEVEANTLSLNEEARRVFASFDAICGNENCGLFVRSSVTYGKSLLYLKDQIKDLERINIIHQQRLKEIEAELPLLRNQVAAARSERISASNQASVAQVVDVVSQLTEKVIQLRRTRQLEEELTLVETEYVIRLGDREKIQTRLTALEGNSTAADLNLLKLRNALQERIKYWLSVLHTSNVSFDVRVDADFNVTFGDQKISKFNGSTLTRIILAIRTGAFDLLVKSEGVLPRFFILDTPRQQDISRENLAEYVKQLQLLASECSAQIVFSTTNHRYELGDGDKEWIPEFPGAYHPMFLGPHSNGNQNK